MMSQSHEQPRRCTDVEPSVVLPFPVPSSDVGLVAALRAGHPDGMRALCERYSEELLTIATRILGPDTFVRPVVVETLRQSLTHLRELTNPRTLRFWLLSRLVVEARRRLRARRRWGWISSERARNWFDVVRCSEQLVATYCLLDRLTVEQRLAFSLVVIHSMGISEAASVLGVSALALTRTLVQAHARFGWLARCNSPRLMRRQSSHASLAAKIALEQDEMLGDCRIYESDLVLSGDQVDWLSRLRGKRIPRLLASAALLIVLTSGIAILVAHLRGAGLASWGDLTRPTELARVGRWVVAEPRQSKMVSFSDGSTIALSPEARLRMLGATYPGSSSVLESGSAALSVTGMEQSEHLVAAGPFALAMTKGQAELSWDSKSELLSVVVHQGDARLSGCQYGTGNAVLAGKSLQVRCLVR